MRAPAFAITQGYDFAVGEELRIWSQVLWGDFGSMSAFAVLLGSAIYFRRRIDAHKRLMLLASISVIGPALSRVAFLPIFDGINFFLFSWGGVLLLLFALLAQDLIVDRKAHLVTAFGVPALLVVRYVSSQVLGNSEFGRSIIVSLSVST